MQNVDCLFCRTPSDSIAIRENGYTGRRCLRCGLIYVSPRPEASDIENLYSHDNARVGADWHFAAELSKRRRARHNLQIVRSHASGRALLELGSGAGFFLDEARRAGFEPHGVELNRILAKHIKDTLRIDCADVPLARSHHPDASFDVAYHSDVLSHLDDPVGTFRLLRRKLRDGALMVFETGNLAEVGATFLRHLDTFQYPDHLCFYRVDHLKSLLRATGFETVAVNRYSLLPQILVSRWLSDLKGAIQGSGLRAPPRGGPVPTPSPRPRHAWSCARRLRSYLDYLLVYKAGAVSPKRRRPQTVIVVAKAI